MSAQFLSQTSHVGVDRAGVDGILIAPDILEEGVAGKNATPAFNHERQELELCGGQFQTLVLQADLKVGLADMKWRDVDIIRVRIGPDAP